MLDIPSISAIVAAGVLSRALLNVERTSVSGL